MLGLGSGASPPSVSRSRARVGGAPNTAGAWSELARGCSTLARGGQGGAASAAARERGSERFRRQCDLLRQACWALRRVGEGRGADVNGHARGGEGPWLSKTCLLWCRCLRLTTGWAGGTARVPPFDFPIPVRFAVSFRVTFRLNATPDSAARTGHIDFTTQVGLSVSVLTVGSWLSTERCVERGSAYRGRDVPEVGLR